MAIAWESLPLSLPTRIPRFGAASPASLYAPSETLASPSRCRYLRRYPTSFGYPLHASGGFSPRPCKRPPTEARQLDGAALTSGGFVLGRRVA